MAVGSHGAAGWKKQRKRRRQRERRIFDQTARVPHFTITYKIDAQENPSDESNPGRLPTTSGPVDPP